MFYFYRFWCLLSCILFSFITQGQTVVYADVTKGDSTDNAIRDLFKELDKAGYGKYTVQPVASYKGSGLLLIDVRKRTNSYASIPAKLKTYGPEGIYIKGDQKTVILAGNSVLALHEAVFIYLEQLGFRYLMPGSVWEEIPSITTLYKPISILTQPDFIQRNFTNGHGYGGRLKVDAEFVNWEKANRMNGAFRIRVGHSYDEIVSRNAGVFKEHPEYFAQPVAKGTIPENPKFNVANKDLVKLVTEDGIRRFEEFKARGEHTNMISMDPSDGGGFCTTPACKAIGGPSEQTFYLSNAVGRELRKKYPDVWVGGFAYNEHIMPPSFKVEPKTFLMITTAFNRSGLTTVQLLKKWKEKIPITGIYDYLSVYEWDFDMPGQVVAARVAANRDRIRQYYDAGARTYLAETTTGWVPRGPGQYILTRVLWDRNTDIEAVKNDFFEKGFGNVAPIIRKLYDNWENYPFTIAMNNDMANWLAWVDEAYNKASSVKIKKRIDELKIYLHYVVLYRKVKAEPTESNLLEVMNYAYRHLDNPSFAALPTLVSLPNYTGFPSLALYASSRQASYKRSMQPFSNTELQTAFRQDIASVKRTAEVKVFSKADAFIKLNTITPTLGKMPFYIKDHAYWGPTEFVFRIVKKDTGNWISIMSNHVKSTDQRPVEMNIYPYTKNAGSLSGKTPVLQFKQDKAMVTQKYSLSTLQPGYYTLKVNDPMKMFTFNFSTRVEYSIVMNPREQLLTTTAASMNTFLFYVPEGTKNFRISKTVTLKLMSPTGREIDLNNGKEEVVEIDVQPGEQGAWMVFAQSGRLFIDGIPPYLGTSLSQMLVPSYLKK